MSKVKNLFDDQGAEVRLAEAIHHLKCHYNHADQCEWYYRNHWRPEEYPTQLRYYDQALRLLAANLDIPVLVMLRIVKSLL